MWNRIYRGLVTIGILSISFSSAVYAQNNNSLNTFSPFTFYGLGELLPAGLTSTQAMGGIGAGYWTPYEVNPVNPAAYSQILQQSSALSFGVSGQGIRLRTSDSKTFNNTFNLNNFGVMFPLGKGVGIALSLTPYSSVGYNIRLEETDPDILTDVGHVMYNYTGDGGISRIKVGMGAKLFKNFSLGADLVTYVGTISRYSTQTITPVGGQSYRAIAESNREEIADVTLDIGFQYDILRTEQRMLTLGGVFHPKTRLNNKSQRQVYTQGKADSIYYDDWRTEVIVPQKITGGVYYRTPKFGIGADYSYQNWTNTANFAEADRVALKETRALHFGAQYTPNAGDIRRVLNRWTYRAGFRYTDLYMTKDGQKMNEKAFTIGVGIPFRQGNFSEMNVGFEVGQRGRIGRTPNGLPMVQEQYFKVSLGVTLFDRNWFLKMRYY